MRTEVPLCVNFVNGAPDMEMRKMMGERSDRRNTCLDYLIMGGIVVIGLAETAHLATVVLGWTFTRCVTLFWGLAGAGSVCCLLWLLLGRRRAAGNSGKFEKGEPVGVSAEYGGTQRFAGLRLLGTAEIVLFAIFGAVVVSQLIFVCVGSAAYRQGDMTVETVGSFLAADGIYRVNPMTGSPYVEGIPSRLKILCLPTLYGSLCKITGLSPRTVVWKIAPILTLLGCYAAFAALGICLFPGKRVLPANGIPEETLSEEMSSGSGRERWDGKKLGCFMLAVSLLLWAGTYQYGVDGFDLLYCGYRGDVIRNMVLAPWLFSLCLRKKWFCAFLCVLAEACMVWTLYGMGVCLFIAVGMSVAQLFYKASSAKDKISK